MRMHVLAGLAAISLTIPSVAFSQSAAPSADELNSQSPPAPANTTVIEDARTGTTEAVVTNHPGNMVSVPPTDQAKDYPVCSASVKDACRNRGEGGAPGRSRATRHAAGRGAAGH